MSDIIRIPMTAEIYDELDDAFVEKDSTSHDFVWKLIRGLCKDAKIGKLNKLCTINVLENGKPKQEHLKLKEITLDDVVSNPNWVPKLLDQNDVAYFEHKVTDRTMKYLKLFASFTMIRHTKYIDSLQQDHTKQLEKMRENKATKTEIIDEAEKNFVKQVKSFVEAIPTCLEEVVFNAVFPAIQQEVNANIEKSFDKENEEMYPKEDPAKTSK